MKRILVGAIVLLFVGVACFLLGDSKDSQQDIATKTTPQESISVIKDGRDDKPRKVTVAFDSPILKRFDSSN